jgi:hypothetical protein
MGYSERTAQIMLQCRLADAARGDPEVYFELGMLYSSGSDGAPIDLIEAHKWFNLAAVGGIERGQECRAEIACDMSAREIADAQRRARAWLAGQSRLAA